MVHWSIGQVFRWSGGPGGPDSSCGPYGPGDQASQGGKSIILILILIKYKSGALKRNKIDLKRYVILF